MYAQHWGLTETPFTSALDARRFVSTLGHDEALARILYVVEEHRRSGILTGPSGTGKSLLLHLVRSEVERQGREIASVDLIGRTSHEVLWEILAGLGLAPRRDESAASLWRRLADHLATVSQPQFATVILMDHLERALSDCLTMIERLQHLSIPDLTLILATRDVPGRKTAPALWDLADMRIKLSPLDRQESRQYVETLLARFGVEHSVFEPSAMERLFEETQGIPRRLNRLCDLALLAGMVDGAKLIDEAMVAAAAQEMYLTIASPRGIGRPRPRFAAGF